MKRFHPLAVATLLAACFSVTLLAATWFNTPVNFDSNGNLKLAAVATGGGQGSSHTLSNSPVNIDSNGNPKVTIASGSATPDTLCLDSTNQDTCWTRAAQGVFAMTGATASNGIRIPNNALPEYGGMAWNANFFNVGTTTNGGTARTTRLNSATSSVILATSSGDSYIGGAAGWTTFAGLTTTGRGAPAIVASAGVAGATNTGTASATTFTVGAADATFLVGCNINIASGATFSFSCDVTYTDQANQARTLVLPISTSAGGTFLATGLVTNVQGAGAYDTPQETIRAKSGTAITIRTSSGGTFTACVYDIYGTILQIT